MGVILDIVGRLSVFRRSLLGFIYAQESNVIGRQKVAVLVYSSLLLILGVVLNLCGIAGPIAPFFQVANVLQGICVIIGLCLYYKRYFSLNVAIGFFCITLQVEISAETIYCTLYANDYYNALIIANVSLSSVVLLLGIISYLRSIPFIVATLSLVTYGISVYMLGSSILGGFFMVFLVVFSALILMGRTMIHNISKLDRENTELKGERQEMLEVFRLTNEELRSYMILAKEQNLESEKTAQILMSVGKVAEKRILDNVAHYIRQSSIDFDKLHERLPELSASELEICTLILKEKKIKEISELLGKAHSNITCQRTNIRAKLGLQSGDNLLEVLRQRLA